MDLPCAPCRNRTIHTLAPKKSAQPGPSVYSSTGRWRAVAVVAPSRAVQASPSHTRRSQLEATPRQLPHCARACPSAARGPTLSWSWICWLRIAASRATTHPPLMSPSTPDVMRLTKTPRARACCSRKTRLICTEYVISWSFLTESSAPHVSIEGQGAKLLVLTISILSDYCARRMCALTAFFFVHLP